MASNSLDSVSNLVFTIGHSNHTVEYLLNLLTQHQISALADVRSTPYSRFNPQFNRKQLEVSLRESGIKYVYLGDQLGGRTEDRSCYDEGRIRYDRLARKPEFEKGIERVIKGSENYRIALMCAEKEPLSCHRTLLVGHELTERGIPLRHILGDGSLESHESTMLRLLEKFNLGVDDDLFKSQRDRDALITEAIANQTALVGHSIKQDSSQNQINQ